MVKKSLKILKKLQTVSGLFSAAACDDTGYSRAWIRDNIYEAIGLENHDMKAALRVYHALLDVLLKHEFKIDWAIKEKPDARFKYIHARYDTVSLEEIHEEWGNKQNDAIGALLFKIGELEQKGISVLRGVKDFRIVQKLVFYLGRIEYWQDEDNGMWEENEEIHASSVGACVAGLKAMQDIVYVPEEYITKGQETLNWLLPRESVTKDVDLSLLSLIYPYNVVSEEIALEILKNVEEKLLREKGVIRYENDVYYGNEHGEPEWTMGLPWLAIIHKKLGNLERYNYLLTKTKKVMNRKGELPELYYAGTNMHNENTPLGWAQAMYLVAVSE